MGYLINDLSNKKNIDYIIKKSLNLECFFIGFNSKTITKSIIKKCKEKNLKVLVFSNKSITFMKALKMWDMGIDSIFIDNPLLYKKILKKI